MKSEKPCVAYHVATATSHEPLLTSRRSCEPVESAGPVSEVVYRRYLDSLRHELPVQILNVRGSNELQLRMFANEIRQDERNLFRALKFEFLAISLKSLKFGYIEVK